MTPTVANLNPAISLFLTSVSTPTHRRTSTCAHIATAVGKTTSRMMRNHSGRLDRKYDTIGLPESGDRLISSILGRSNALASTDASSGFRKDQASGRKGAARGERQLVIPASAQRRHRPCASIITRLSPKRALLALAAIAAMTSASSTSSLRPHASQISSMPW